MRRIVGYTLFWIAMGMMIMILLDSHFLGIVIIAACFLLSYYLFTC